MTEGGLDYYLSTTMRNNEYIIPRFSSVKDYVTGMTKWDENLSIEVTMNIPDICFDC